MTKIEKTVIKSSTGFIVEVLNLGGIITKIMAFDKTGNRENVVLNYENIDDYVENPLFLGCFVGPVAGRTENGQIEIDEYTLKLDVNTPPNSLHSGKDGLHNVIWKVESQTDDSVTFIFNSLIENRSIHYKITYQVFEETLSIDYFVTSNHKTYLSLTNHSYFNLSGNHDQSIKSHSLKLNCSHFARLNGDNLPFELIPLKSSPLDFTTETLLGTIIEGTSNDILMASGIDHPFKCDQQDGIAVLKDFASGRVMKVSTTQPYVIIYSGNFLNTAVSPSGKTFNQYSGICFETQNLPNVTSNKLDQYSFIDSSTPYQHQTQFTFSVE